MEISDRALVACGHFELHALHGSAHLVHGSAVHVVHGSGHVKGLHEGHVELVEVLVCAGTIGWVEISVGDCAYI